MRIDVLTLFPELFGPFFGTSIPKRAAAKGVVSYHLHDLRASATDAHKSVDDKPFGGGPGMVLMAPVLADAIAKAAAEDAVAPRVVVMTPQGRPFTQRVAEEYATLPRLLLIAGRYEGFDERIFDALQPDEVSLGDFVLSGGELAAMAVVDAVVRLLPGALGHDLGAADESFADGLLEGPQYTRPRDWQGRGVPDVLLSGDHDRIARWHLDQRRARTKQRRPDLWAAYAARHGLDA